MDEATLPREIERKYLLTGAPELPAGAERILVEQGWLPGERFRERVRRTTLYGQTGGQAGGQTLVYHRGFKLGRGLERIEIEEPTTAEIFEVLWTLTKGCRVKKERFIVKEGGFSWEVDVFLDRELTLAEVELPTIETIAPPPPWLLAVIDREVTEETGFTNLEMAF